MNKQPDRKVGIKDIAVLAGVSIGTIDRVLHNRSEVSEVTRKRVMKIVEELGYTPNIFAKSLSSKKTTKIAIVLPDFSENNPYWEKPIIGIKQAAEELVHYNAEIIYEHFDSSNEESFRAVLQKITAGNPDGVVLNPVFEKVSKEFITVFDERKIPYVFIDMNLMGVNNLAYFGQDAEQSGRVAAQLMDLFTQNTPKIAIVKLSKSKVFSQHIESRIEGFNKYFNDTPTRKQIQLQTIEIDINSPNESLSKTLTEGISFDGIFVPNSRGFKLGDYFESIPMKAPITIGYDLVDQNVYHLKNGNITCLISQKPEEQAYKAIWALFDNLVSKKEVEKTNFSSIDIILKENIDYYNSNK